MPRVWSGFAWYFVCVWPRSPPSPWCFLGFSMSRTKVEQWWKTVWWYINKTKRKNFNRARVSLPAKRSWVPLSGRRSTVYHWSVVMAMWGLACSFDLSSSTTPACCYFLGNSHLIHEESLSIIKPNKKNQDTQDHPRPNENQSHRKPRSQHPSQLGPHRFAQKQRPRRFLPSGQSCILKDLGECGDQKLRFCMVFVKCFITSNHLKWPSRKFLGPA